jgi:L,D-transpeptidase YbiS
MRKPSKRKTVPPLLIVISVGEQRLRLRQAGKILMTCAISTSKSGLGTAPGSNKTPTGRFRVTEKHGQNAPHGTIFKSRQPVGVWRGDDPPAGDDLITSRILWLDGLEKRNANTYERYIYIHGTNHEHLLGIPASHGCIRMKNDDVISLFDAVPVGTEVRIG